MSQRPLDTSYVSAEGAPDVDGEGTSATKIGSNVPRNRGTWQASVINFLTSTEIER